MGALSCAGFTQLGDPGALDERLEHHLFCAAGERTGVQVAFQKATRRHCKAPALARSHAQPWEAVSAPQMRSAPGLSEPPRPGIWLRSALLLLAT